ncbi:hypothetical protein C3L33_09564, partial [Rhododendron williamsianum]
MVKRKRNSLPTLPSETELKQLIGNQTEFSLSLAKQVSLSESKDSNLVFSPPSIHVVLGLIAAGSKGKTQAQLLSLLNSDSTDDLNSLSSHLVSHFFADGSPTGGPKLSFANGVWVDRSLSLKPSFKRVVDTFYKAASNHVDFQTKAVEATNEVNQWAEKQTNGLVKEILPSSSVVFSPPLIQVVLGLIASGSNGPTQAQLLSLLNSDSADDINSLASHLVSHVFANGSPTGGSKLSFANGVWVDQSLSLKPSFKQVVDTVYKATSNHVDFQTKAIEVTNEVNQWAEKETNGLIKEVEFQFKYPS